MKKIMILAVVILFAQTAFGRTSAAELSRDCDALKAKGPAVYTIDRNSDLGFCLGYMNAVFDSIEENHDIEVAKDFIVGDMIQSFQSYEPHHYAEAADGAILNAMIADGILRRKTHDKSDPSGTR